MGAGAEHKGGGGGGGGGVGGAVPAASGLTHVRRRPLAVLHVVAVEGQLLSKAKVTQLEHTPGGFLEPVICHQHVV